MKRSNSPKIKTDPTSNKSKKSRKTIIYTPRKPNSNIPIHILHPPTSGYEGHTYNFLNQYKDCQLLVMTELAT